MGAHQRGEEAGKLKKITRVFITPKFVKDAERAARLQRILNAPDVLRELNARAEHEILMMLLYGPDKSRWPN